jgi:hypothetical protein
MDIPRSSDNHQPYHAVAIRPPQLSVYLRGVRKKGLQLDVDAWKWSEVQFLQMLYFDHLSKSDRHMGVCYNVCVSVCMRTHILFGMGTSDPSFGHIMYPDVSAVDHVLSHTGSVTGSVTGSLHLIYPS